MDFIGVLKHLPRTGWLQNGVPPAVAETVAAHSFEAAALALLVSEELGRRGVAIDAWKAAVIALVHDWAEAVIGDLPRPAVERGGVDGLKNRLEALFFERLGVGGLFEEYVGEGSREGVVAKLGDYLATIAQALRYEALGYSVGGIRDYYVTRVRELVSKHAFLRRVEDLLERLMEAPYQAP